MSHVHEGRWPVLLGTVALAVWPCPGSPRTAGEHSPFPEIDHEIALQPILDQLAPPDRVRDEETESKYPEIIGGLGLALAQAFKIVHPDLKNPQSHHWDPIRAIFDLLL